MSYGQDYLSSGKPSIRHSLASCGSVLQNVTLRRMGRPARKPADRDLIVSMGERLRWVRFELGMTQAQIAEAVGVHQSTWSLYERGLRWPDQFEAVRVIAKLKISRQYLLEGSLEGVARNLAILLAARHPELADSISTVDHTDTVQA